MKEAFTKFFRYIPRSTSIQLYGLSHILYILISVSAVVLLCRLMHKRSEKAKDRAVKILAFLTIFVYVFDFFVQPFWAGEICVGKLPFHICTATGVLIPFVVFSKKFKFLERVITVWAVLAPLAFIFAPMNYINRAVEPYSYPIIQTFLFHALEFAWGVFMLTSGKVKLPWQTIWQPIIGLFPMALWATLGQNMYYGESMGENFLFLRTDVSGIVPHWVFIIALFLAACIAILLTYAVCFVVQKIKKTKV